MKNSAIVTAAAKTILQNTQVLATTESTRETHYCNELALRVDCDEPGQYYNWLACECLNIADGTDQGLLPSWATVDDIAISVLNGAQAVLLRPADWRDICPREAVLLPCDSDYYWNELACQCFSTYFENEGCEEEQWRDPRSSEGKCVRANQLYEELYPLWANPNDILTSELEGLVSFWEDLENSYRRCPYNSETSTPSCPDGQYWNELACQCFTVTFCLMACDEGQDFHPLKQCECESKESIKKELYPVWATDIEIERANQAGLKRFYSKPPPVPDTTDELDGEFEWLGCDIVPWCDDDEYLDELTCQCAPLDSLDDMKSGGK